MTKVETFATRTCHKPSAGVLTLMLTSTAILDARVADFTDGAKPLITGQTATPAMLVTLWLANRSAINAHCLTRKRAWRIDALVTTSTRHRFVALVDITTVYRPICIAAGISN